MIVASSPRPDFTAPTVDYHALAPEIILAVGICVVLLVDLFVEERQRWITSTLAGFVLLGAFVPVVTLAVHGDDVRNALGGDLLDGRYVVDDFALVLKAMFLGPATSSCCSPPTRSRTASTTRASTTCCCSAACSAW